MKPLLFNTVIKYSVLRDGAWSNEFVSRNQVKAFGTHNAMQRAQMGLRLRLQYNKTISSPDDLNIRSTRVVPAAGGM